MRVRAVGPEHSVSPDFPEVRTNDLALDPAGRLVVSLFTEDRVSPRAALVRLDPDSGVTTTLVGDVVTGNGIGFSPDGSRMYWVDTARGTLSAASYDPVGSAGPATVIVREPGPGRLDGLVVDGSGDVWVAVWDAGEVRRYAPDGTLARDPRHPRRPPSAVALVGPELLVVTTARQRPRPGRRPTVARPRGPAVRIPPALTNRRSRPWSCWTGSPPNASASG